jgi:ABC-type sugar transport system substrate-binding protein
MKKSTALIFAASVLFLAGCCTAPHAAKWEYKIAFAPNGTANTYPTQENRDVQQTLLNDLGKDGWVLISADNGTFYFKRPVK